MVKGVLEPGSKLQWSSSFREEAKVIEQLNKARGRKISQDQIVEGSYSTLERQTVYDDHTLDFTPQQL